MIERIVEIERRPQKCPVCFGDICDILYRRPGSVNEDEYFFKTGHKVLYSPPRKIDGTPWPEFQCEFCGLKFRKGKKNL